MGNGLMRRLEQQEIEAIITEENEPDFVVNAYLDGSLVKKTLESCQHEHEHEHEYRHNHQHRHRHAH